MFVSDVERVWIDGLEKHLEAFSGYVCKQRWFRSKEKQVQNTRLYDYFAREKNNQIYLLLMIQFDYACGSSEIYFAPMVGICGDAVNVNQQPVIFFELNRIQYALLDAFTSIAFEKWFFSMIGEGKSMNSRIGKLIFNPHSNELGLEHLQDSQIRNLNVEQSNTSIVIDGRCILKVYRQIEKGINPEIEILDFLSRHSYKHVPQIVADIIYEANDGSSSSSIGLMGEFIKSEYDGWGYVLQSLKQIYSHSDVFGTADTFCENLKKIDSTLLSDIKRIGQLTGELHIKFAIDHRDSKFTPEMISLEDTKMWADKYCDLVDQSMALMNKKMTSKTEGYQRFESILKQSEKLKSVTNKLNLLVSKKIHKIRQHGDFHLGQVLKGKNGWILFDFEGEPLRSIQDRKQKYCALKDVAGMLRSLSYAAHVSHNEYKRNYSEFDAQATNLRALAETAMRQEFMNAYFEATKDQSLVVDPIVSSDRKTNERVLEFYELDKAIYELIYELNNRPDWVDVPLHGINRLLNI